MKGFHRTLGGLDRTSLKYAIVQNRLFYKLKECTECPWKPVFLNMKQV